VVSDSTERTIRKIGNRCAAVAGPLAVPWGGFIVARIHHFLDEEHAMRVTCYLVSAVGTAISIGVVVYVIFLR
jgi:hypothetical protein